MSSAETSDHDALISQLSSLASIPPAEASQYLEANQWDLSSAATEYYTSLEDQASRGEADADLADPPIRAPSPLGNAEPQPIPTTSSMPPAPSTSASQPPKKKFATLGDLGGGGPSSHGGHGHDDEGDESDEEPQDLFAGGEKSGLAVQNPDDLKRKIIQQAQRDTSHRHGEHDPQTPVSRFTGTARTLGGDDAPSRVIEDPNASAPPRPRPVERYLHFWQDGFSVDDGPLYRTDDPANAEILAMIRRGRAPLHIMNVDHTQEVDVKLETHDGKYVQPKKQYKPFSGGGQRLGSPTPGNSLSSTTATPATIDTTAIASAESTAPTMDIDNSQPTLSLQIRLGDGTRLVSRFNTAHTIGDVYEFINASSSASRDRSWVLMTTFPNKELQDKSQILGELAELKRGGVVVQKWK